MECTFDIILSGADVVLPSMKKEKLDIGILDSKINQLGDLSRAKSKDRINLKGLLVIPGAIDTQVHFREPGLTHKEDIFHGTKGAILGGVTTIFEMPNTNPPTTNSIELKKKVLIAEKNAYCNFSFFLGASKDNIKNINKLENESGCCGVKIFMGSSTGDLLVEDDEYILKILKVAKRMVAVHSEDEFRLRERMNFFSNDDISVLDHPKIRDVLSAVTSTKRLINAAKKANKKIHILHISTKEEIPILRENKKILSCEVTPQHLFFSSPECYETLGSLSQMNPPIRDESHKEALWNALTEGVIDVIGSDHAPHTLEEKKKKYPKSPSGMTGVQTLLPVMLNFVNQGKLSIFDLVRMVSSKPSEIYKIKNKGKIKVGFDADLTIIDMNREFRVSNEWIASKSKWTPYDNVKIKGLPVFTIVNGKIVMRDSDVIGNPSGQKVLFKD